MKICAGASSGGHMNQLLRLLQYTDSWPYKPAMYVTTLDVLATVLQERGRTYIIGECNRRHPLRAFITFIRSIFIVRRERPDIVITTGSMPLAFFCLVAKVHGARIVWIDSIANSEKFSLSGQMVIYFADLFLTQWPELAKNSKAEFAGAIL